MTIQATKKLLIKMKDFDERLIDCYSSNQAFSILQMIFKSIFKNCLVRCSRQNTLRQTKVFKNHTASCHMAAMAAGTKLFLNIVVRPAFGLFWKIKYGKTSF